MAPADPVDLFKARHVEAARTAYERTISATIIPQKSVTLAATAEGGRAK